jgi:hypothetical protein
MAWLSDYQAALRKEIESVEFDINSGGCLPPEHALDAEKSGMAYRVRLGHLSGLRRAAQILEKIERVEEAA